MQTFLSYFTILTSLFLTSLACAQPDTLWTSMVVGSGNTILTSAALLPDDGFVVAGYTYEGSNTNFYVARLDADGFFVWGNSYTSSAAFEEAHGVAVVGDTIFVVGFGEANDQPGAPECVLFVGISLNGDSLWSRHYQPTGTSKARDVILLSDGTLGVIGYLPENEGSHSDAWFLKCDTNGDTLWTKRYGSIYTDLGQQLQEMPDGSILLLCNNKPSNSESYNLWPVRINPDGQILSQNTFGTSAEEYGYGVLVESDGSIFLVGRQSTTAGRAGYVVGMPAEGNGWTQAYDEDGDYVEFHGILYRSSTSICVGQAGASSSLARPFLMGIDEEGNRNWSWMIGDPGNGNVFNGIIPITSDGDGLAYGSYSIDGWLRGFVMRIAPLAEVSGVVTETDSEEPLQDVRVSAVGQGRFAITDVNGAYVLELAPGMYDLVASGECVASDTLFSVAIPDGGHVNADFSIGVPNFAYSQSSVNMIAMNHQHSNGIYHLTNNGSGAMEFTVSADCINPHGNWMTLSPTEGIVPPGESEDISITVFADTTDDGTYAYYGQLNIHTNSCPNNDRIIPVLVSVLDIDAPTETVHSFGLNSIYPNPFNNEATIRFGIEQPGQASLKVYDISGREVAVLTDNLYSAGSHTLRFSLPTAASGLYFVRLQTGNQSDFRKVALIK